MSQALRRRLELLECRRRAADAGPDGFRAALAAIDVGAEPPGPPHLIAAARRFAAAVALVEEVDGGSAPAHTA